MAGIVANSYTAGDDRIEQARNEMLRRGWMHWVATIIAFGGGVALPLLPISLVPNAIALIVSALAVLFAFAKDAWIA